MAAREDGGSASLNPATISPPARSLGAVACLNSSSVENIAEVIRDLSGGGAHVSMDAIGSAEVSCNSIDCLRKRGRHIQVGLLVNDNGQVKIPMARILANELEILGSHGMQAHRYVDMLEMISAGRLSPDKLIGRTITLEKSIAALTSMNEFSTTGVTVITEF